MLSKQKKRCGEFCKKNKNDNKKRSNDWNRTAILCNEINAISFKIESMVLPTFPLISQNSLDKIRDLLVELDQKESSLYSLTSQYFNYSCPYSGDLNILPKFHSAELLLKIKNHTKAIHQEIENYLESDASKIYRDKKKEIETELDDKIEKIEWEIDHLTYYITGSFKSEDYKKINQEIEKCEKEIDFLKQTLHPVDEDHSDSVEEEKSDSGKEEHSGSEKESNSDSGKGENSDSPEENTPKDKELNVSTQEESLSPTVANTALNHAKQ